MCLAQLTCVLLVASMDHIRITAADKASDSAAKPEKAAESGPTVKETTTKATNQQFDAGGSVRR